MTFAGSSWFLPALALAALTLGLLIWSYAAAPNQPTRWIAPLLKWLGILTLAFCLLDPLRPSQRVRPGANLFAVIADSSQSLALHDPGQSLSRADQLRLLLQPNPTHWLTRLAEDFDVRRFTADARLVQVEHFADLEPRGRASALITSLQQLAERFQGRPLAGILLLTDGNATDAPNTPSLPLQNLPPVYPVALGESSRLRDLSLSRVSAQPSDFEDQPVTIDADLDAPGFRGRRVIAELHDPSGNSAARLATSTRTADAPTPLRLTPQPREPGVAFYHLSVALDSPSPDDAEATLANNHRFLAIDRGRGPYRILYVAGRPNWEFKFLNRALAEDPQIRLTALLRVARREPKFEFRGRTGETSNPLFRGFGDQSPEETQRYDQPVIIRINPPDESETTTDFPRTAQDLFRYHAIIIDDLEAAFFTPAQASLVQRFVSERGGGLLMLGGMESFREGLYHRNPIGDTLPVYLDSPPSSTPTPGAPVRFDLAREGWLLPWARLRDREPAERDRLDAMPPFLVANLVAGVKPGASIIATARDDSGRELPALITQRFGHGRSAALTLGDLWRWGMRDPQSRTDLDKSWRQLARWLVSETPQRVAVSAEPIPGDPLGAVQLQTRVRDPLHLPLDQANVSLEIEPVAFASLPVTNPPPPLQLRAEPSPDEPGLYLATYIPRGAGAFRARASASDEQGADIGRADTGWAANPVAEELRSLTPNVPLLEQIARQTGGQLLRPKDLDDLIQRLPRKAAPVMETIAQPAWHNTPLFAFALLCLIGEWGLRRWKGLP